MNCVGESRKENGVVGVVRDKLGRKKKKKRKKRKKKRRTI